MTPEQIEALYRFAPFIEAVHFGRGIQRINSEGIWQDAELPSDLLLLSPYDFQIKEIKWRRWENSEVPLGMIVRSQTDHTERFLITGVNKKGVILANSIEVDLRDMFKHVECSMNGGCTWQPCGTREG